MNKPDPNVIVQLFGEPVVKRVTPVKNSIQLHPPKAQHMWTRQTVMNDQLVCHRRSQVFVNSLISTFLWSMVFSFAIFMILGVGS